MVSGKLNSMYFNSSGPVVQSISYFMKLVVKDIVNPIALRKAKIVYNFGLSECSRVNSARTHEFKCANSL